MGRPKPPPSELAKLPYYYVVFVNAQSGKWEFSQDGIFGPIPIPTG
jgi:hypothetical protein